jgi:type IV secretory pathway VirB10-like protein
LSTNLHKAKRCLYIVCACLLGYSTTALAQQFESLPRLQPEIQPEASSPDAVPQRLIEPTNVPDFPAGSATSSNVLPSDTTQPNGFTSSTPLQSGIQSTILPIQTHLKLVLETPVDAKTSTPGEIFEAHVRDDLYVGQSLLLPRGSLVRGRVFSIQKPRIISRAARISLKLEQIVTPTGEVIPLDAALTFNKGKTNSRGELDPGTSFGTRVSSNVKTVTGANSKGTARGALVAANVATLGAPAVAALIGGSAVALFKSGDNVDLKPGDEVEVCLTNDLGLQLN